MAIGVSDRAVAEIKKAAAQRARRRPRGCASASAAAAARASRTCSSGRTASRAPRTRCSSFEDGAVRVFVDPKSFLYLDGSTLEYQTTLMGRGFKFDEPEREGDLRLRRERPVLASRLAHRCIMICWSCQKRERRRAALRRLRRDAAAGRRRDPFAVLGLPRSSTSISAAAGGALQGAVAAAAPGSLRQGRSARAARVARAHGAAQRGLADAEGSGQARGVLLRAGGHRRRRREPSRGEREATQVRRRRRS